MAKVRQKYLVIHCTATREDQEISSDTIREWHMKKRGWSRVGYSDMIHLDGSLENLHFAEGSNPYDKFIESSEMTWGVKGQNAHSKHIVYVGGVEKERSEGSYPAKDTRTSKQRETLEIYLKLSILRDPELLIAGHNQFSSKACPSFNVREYCREIGILDKNILQIPGLYERPGESKKKI